jgi:ABC-type cobalamin transport system permease subunit
LGFAASLVQTRGLDLLQLGEETAASLGVDVELPKRMLTLTAAIPTGAAVAAGLIGFVGLVVPHGRVATRLLLLQSGRIVTTGSHEEVLTPSTLETVFHVRADVSATADGSRFYFFRRLTETAQTQT